MKKQTQHGKGLSGFFSGLLLATAVIIGILFFLNKENRGGFKEVKPAKEVSETEVLQPKGNRTKPRQEEDRTRSRRRSRRRKQTGNRQRNPVANRNQTGRTGNRARSRR